MTYRWCLVAACIDQYTITSTDARLRNFAKARIAYRVTAMITIVWLILPIHILVFSNISTGRCTPYIDATALYHSIFTTITGSVLPILIMFIGVMFTRRNLVLMHTRRIQITANQQNNNEHTRHKRDQQVFVMLLLQLLVYVITQTPWMFFNIYITVTINTQNKSADRIAIERFISFMNESIVYLLAVLPFYLYTLASRRFRGELMNLLHCPLRYRWRNNIAPINPLQNSVPVTMNIVPVQTLAHPTTVPINK